MPSSSSSSAQAARQHLADQLRELRETASLSGLEFAKRAGWRDSSKISKVERAVRSASAADVRLWCRLCGASEQRTEELLAEQRAVAGMWVTYKQLNRGGLKRAQQSIRGLYDRVKLMRVYQTRVIPGLLQTEAFTAAALTAVRLKQAVAVDDVERDIVEAVGERMDRQGVLRRQGKRFLFVVEEDILWYRPWGPDIHVGQLRHLLEVIRLPSVVFGVIPRRAGRRDMLPVESFTMADTEVVLVELVSGFLSISQPDEVEAYVRVWDRLWSLSVFGNDAVTLIHEALNDLRP
jgi:transcriptional regulator with XRE-family HTH domain